MVKIILGRLYNSILLDLFVPAKSGSDRFQTLCFVPKDILIQIALWKYFICIRSWEFLLLVLPSELNRTCTTLNKTVSSTDIFIWSLCFPGDMLELQELTFQQDHLCTDINVDDVYGYLLSSWEVSSCATFWSPGSLTCDGR